MRFLATNRARAGNKWLGELAQGNALTYWSGDDASVEMDSQAFQRAVIAEAARQFESGVDSPLILGFIHGFNVDRSEAVAWGERIEERLTGTLPGPPILVVFDWPSEGMVSHYLDDREVARQSAPPLHRLVRGAIQAIDAARCPARLAIMAHSLGCFALAHAAGHAWEGMGRPESFNAFTETLLIAADLDDNALEPGRDGWALAALSRRLTVWRSGHDAALLASMAKRAGVTGGRLGREGPARPDLIPTNVAVVDASEYAKRNAHSSYFEEPRLLEDLRQVLAGVDRAVIAGRENVGQEFRLVEVLDR